jgi:hypothetical protein
VVVVGDHGSWRSWQLAIMAVGDHGSWRSWQLAIIDIEKVVVGSHVNRECDIETFTRSQREDGRQIASDDKGLHFIIIENRSD